MVLQYQVLVHYEHTYSKTTKYMILAYLLQPIYHAGYLRYGPSYNQRVHCGSGSAQGASYLKQENVGDV